MSTFAFYVNEFPAGGTGTAVAHTADELTAKGHRVIVYTARHITEQYPVDYQPQFEVVIVPSLNPDTDDNVSFLCRHIREHQVAALVVVAMHFFRMREVRQNTCCKMVYALHGCPLYEAKDLALSQRHWYDRWLHNSKKKVLPIYRETIAVSDRYVVLCEDYVRILVKELRLSQSDTQKMRVIPNGILTTDAPQMKKEKIILFVGRLSFADKRPMRLVDIWSRIYKQLPDWRFVIVGDGPEKASLQEAVSQRGIERMDFPGFTNDTVSYYQKASIICLTSEYEGWPLCLAEGQAYGVVPIAFSCTAGICDIISPSGVNGVLVPPYDCAVFADKLLQMTSDGKWLSQMRDSAVEKAKTYAMSRNSEGYCRLLEELN